MKLKDSSRKFEFKKLTFEADHPLGEPSRRAKKIYHFQRFDLDFYDYCSCWTVTHSAYYFVVLVVAGFK